MAWSVQFLSELTKKRLSLAYILEVIEVWNEPAAAWSCASVPGLGVSQLLGVASVQVQGTTLSPRGWTATVGAFSVDLVGDIQEACQHLARGTIVRLLALPAGWSTGSAQVIAIGQVRGLRGIAPRWRLECWDIVAAMRQRLEVGQNQSGLFTSIGSSTTLAADYTPGDIKLEVASTTGFNRESGSEGAILVTPTSGDPFYLTWTGTATGPVQFTGIGVSAVMGTTAVAAVVGDTVEEVAYLTGHPLDIARKVLASRGTSNGSYDTLPSGWGIGLSDDLIDHQDINIHKTAVVVAASGAYTWQYAQAEAANDVGAWLSELLSPAGIFLTSRQGLLTVRGGQAATSPRYVSGYSISDADIAEVVSWDAWDPGHAEEYNYILAWGYAMNSASVATISSTASLPKGNDLRYDLTDRVWSNIEILYEIHQRLEESGTRIPERLVLRCAGLRLAALAPGDIVDLTTTRVHSKRDGSAGYNARYAMVDEVSPDWPGMSCTVGLLIYPEDENLFS